MIRYLIRIIFSVGLLLTVSSYAATKQNMSPENAKQFVKNAVVYALENMDPNLDYSKYVAKDFVNPIDGNTFNYEQWVTHQKHIKSLVKSMTPTFDLMVAEGNHVAAIFHIKIIKKDGSELEVKDMAFFTIKNHKIVYVEELTRLTKGSEKDKNIGSTK